MPHQIIITGNVTGKPVLSETRRGKRVCNFMVAVNDWHQSGSRTVWIKAVAWGTLATICADNLKRSELIFIRGRLSAHDSGHPRSWLDPDGNPRAHYEVIVEELQFLHIKPNNASSRFGNE